MLQVLEQAVVQKKEDFDSLKQKVLAVSTSANSTSWEMAQVTGRWGSCRWPWSWSG